MHDLIHHHKPDGSVYPIDECPLYGAFKNGREPSYIDSGSDVATGWYTGSG